MKVPVGHLPTVIFNKLATEYRRYQICGGMPENAVLQALLPQIGPDKPYYWTSEGRAEIEFLVDVAGQVIPVEVKAEGNTNGRSLSVYTQKFNPVRRIRISMNNLQENDGLYSIPNPLADWALKLSGR